MNITNVAVIGAGTMGNGIAHVFAQNGFKVNLVDVNPAQLEKARQTIAKNLDRQIAKGGLTEDQKQSTLANIASISDLATGVSAVGLVVEAATENADLKKKSVEAIMQPSFPFVDAQAPIEEVSKLITKDSNAVLMKDLAGVTHIITKHDIIHAVAYMGG